MDGNVHWFGVPGIVNGLAVLRDEESNSLWDHITGECFDGPHAGKRLPFWGIDMTTVEAELATHPDVILLKSPRIPFFKSTMMNLAIGKEFINKEGTTLIPMFRRSMHSAIDDRLPEGENGLGVMTDDHQAKFYPMSAIPKGGQIEDEFLGRTLIIERGAIDGVPRAKWADSDGPNGNGRPMQLLTRWYGFSFTYPGCDIYS